jgi:hypothetical protein
LTRENRERKRTADKCKPESACAEGKRDTEKHNRNAKSDRPSEREREIGVSSGGFFARVEEH